VTVSCEICERDVSSSHLVEHQKMCFDATKKGTNYQARVNAQMQTLKDAQVLYYDVCERFFDSTNKLIKHDHITHHPPKIRIDRNIENHQHSEGHQSQDHRRSEWHQSILETQR